MNFSDIVVELGLAVVKDRAIEAVQQEKVKNEIRAFLEREAKYNEYASREEEIDIEGLYDYIINHLVEDSKVHLFGRTKDRQAARQTIIAKSTAYAKAKTPESIHRVAILVLKSVDILREFYRNKANQDLRFLFAEFEDALISSNNEQHNDQLEKIKGYYEQSQDYVVEAIKQTVHDNSILSIDRNIMLLDEGNIEGVEKSLSTFFQAISSEHPLPSDYKYEPVISGDSLHIQSVPLRPESVVKYPPRIKCATTICVENQNVSSFSSATIDYANRHQYPIIINIKDAKKFLGDIVDPAQHEARQLVGRDLVINPTPFPEAFPCSIIVNDNIEFEYILLRTQEILDDGSILISNTEQSTCPYRIKLRVHLETQELDCSFSVLNANNKDLLKYDKFMQRVATGVQLRIHVLSRDVDIISATIKPFEFKSGFECVEDEIAFLESLITLEEYFGVPINIDGDIFDNDLAIIQYICSLVNGYGFQGTWSRYDATKTITTDLKEKINSWRDIAGDLKVEGNREFRLFNHDYSIRVSRIYNRAVIQDLSRLKNKVEILDIDDTVRVNFVPEDASGIGTYKDNLLKDIDKAD